MIVDFINKNKNYIIAFTEFNGSGWTNSVESIIKNKIKPQSISKKDIEVGWYYSEYEFSILKDGISFVFHIDDEGSTYLLLKDKITGENKNKLKEWATIIAEGINELKSS